MVLDSYVKSIAMLHSGNNCKQQMLKIIESIIHQVDSQKAHEIDVAGNIVLGIEAMISSQEGNFRNITRNGIEVGTRKSKAITCIMDKSGNCFLTLNTIHSECEKKEDGYDLNNEQIVSQSRKPITIEKYASMAQNFELTYF